MIRKIGLAIIILFSSIINTQAALNNLIISEVCIINDNVIKNEDGDYSDWIELYNTGADKVNLNGLFLSDNIDNIFKHQINSTDLVIDPGCFLLLWADNKTESGSTHIGFKLSKGESLILCDPSKVIIDSINITEGHNNISVGKTTMKKTSPWRYFISPTPGAPNNSDAFIGFAGTPSFNSEGGFYTNTINIEFTANPNETIYYTLDNHEPDIDSTYSQVYNDVPLQIESTTVVRAQCYREGYLPGAVISNNYFINETYSLPVFAVVTDPNNLYGETGIYSHPWSEGSDWERFAQNQYFINNKLTYNGNSGIRIQGGNSVGMAKKSFRLHFRAEYGEAQLNYPLFKYSNLTSFQQIVLRSGYDDDLTISDGTLLRDPLSSDLWRISGNLCSSSEWGNLILNGSFWGIYNLRESIDEDFIADHLGVDDFDMIRYQKTGPELKYGKLDEWNKLDSFFVNTDFTYNTAYDTACSLIDMDNFLDLLAFVHCTEFRGWTWGVSAYKKSNTDDKWRWTIWDTDRSYLLPSWNGFTEYAITTNEKWANYMPQYLLKNENFKNALINRTADFLNSYFLPEKSIHVLDSLASIIEPEIANEKARWKPESNWEENVNNMKSFLSNRPEIVRDQIKNHFSIDSTFTIEINASGKGTVLVNSIRANTFPWTGIYFKNIPVSLTAIPAKGYKFNGWSNHHEGNEIKSYCLLGDSSITAIFSPDTTTQYNIVINEVMYNPGENWPSNDWIELFGCDEDTDLAGWWINDGNPNHQFVFPDGTTIEGNSYLVVSCDLAAFRSVNTDNTINTIGSFGDGDTGFGLSGSGDCILLYKSDGILIDSVCYDDKLPWSEMADGEGPSLQLRNPFLDNNIPSNWETSTNMMFTPGYINFNTSGIESQTVDKNKIKIYPNPAQNIISFLVPDNDGKIKKLYIYSMTGKLQAQNSISQSIDGNTINYDISNLPKGLYFLKIETKQTLFSGRFFKQ